MNAAPLLTHHADGVLTLVLNRPERRNALTPELQQDLITALEAAREPAMRVVILTGAGSAFCAGLDLESLQSLADAPVAAQHAAAQLTARLFRTLYTLPLPTIAAVNGVAVAGGTGLATLCDFTLAVPYAHFGYTETRIGYIPALVSVYLSRQIGEKRARGLLLSGRTFDAAEAHSIGLVDEVVEPADLLPRAQAIALHLQQKSSAALRATKQMLLQYSLPELDAQLALALAASAESRSHPDFREGIAAFLEKRKPVWRS
jgi:methylglutaconyl-CoA hydratase